MLVMLVFIFRCYYYFFCCFWCVIRYGTERETWLNTPYVCVNCEGCCLQNNPRFGLLCIIISLKTNSLQRPSYRSPDNWLMNICSRYMILDDLASGCSTKICGRPSNFETNLFGRLHVFHKESRLLRCSVRAPIVIQFSGFVYLFVVYEVNILRLAAEVHNG